MTTGENRKITAALAPMAGYTDTVFRAICSRFGASSSTSEMISSIAMVHNDAKTAALAEIGEDESPVFLQIFGHDPATMAEAARRLLSGSFDNCKYAAPPAGIDINMGCPVRKIVTSGDGSALMRDVGLASRIAAEVKNVCVRFGVPLSVKFRLGWDEGSINAADFACAMAKSGADAITLHCRTKEQLYAPSARPLYCRAVRDALDAAGFCSIPLYGNGDVCSREAAQAYLKNGCAGVSIGRAALSDPWLFSSLSRGEDAAPTIDGRIALISEYVTSVAERLGEARGVRESRSRAAYLLHGVRGSARVRGALNHETTLSGFLAVLKENFERVSDEK